MYIFIENKIKKDECSYYESTDAIVVRQPLIALNEYNLKFYKRVFRKIKKIINLAPKKPQIIDYNIIANLEKNYFFNNTKKEYFGCSVGWDNTPRHKNYGQVFSNKTPEIFQHTFKILLQESKKIKNEFLFINAWNEWAEGMYLEPDEENGYNYLEVIKKTKEAVLK